MLILMAESIKMQLFLITQFLFMHQTMLVLVEYLCNIIQFVIAWSFVNKVLNIAQLPNVQKVVAILMILVFISLVIISIVVMAQSENYSCHKNFLGEEWDFIMVFSLLQSLVIIISSIYLTRVKYKTAGFATQDEIYQRRLKMQIQRKSSKAIKP
jgi:hypothetical protein